MRHLLINGHGAVAMELGSRLRADGGQVDELELVSVLDGDGLKTLLRQAAVGGSYRNVFLDLTDGFDELAEFAADPRLAIEAMHRRTKTLLHTLKHCAQHMARGGGGRIWVLCCDHSLNSSLDVPCNPVMNLAATAAVCCLAKEVAHLDVYLNLFMMHPPEGTVARESVRLARDNLHVYGLRYRPQPAASLAETLHMYASLNALATTGGVIPLGGGISTCNI
ncbi:hypothetical protein NTD86_09970 [Pseudomonas sp. 7P_10.2_Bac1]|uniref:hypothetical protein n=1 Tax=Pseudomonas sp. 7P_10.2_Bac1 TaxID=2971614 RepID=UPI0021C93F83|nr:hypothetical protein [Pseudomonas sp. 7P_10.2_Bac1]MCU1727309.1 hypothetical protein [Pseudomonas sp. 7P_10.2_Bac1]